MPRKLEFGGQSHGLLVSFLESLCWYDSNVSPSQTEKRESRFLPAVRWVCLPQSGRTRLSRSLRASPETRSPAAFPTGARAHPSSNSATPTFSVHFERQAHPKNVLILKSFHLCRKAARTFRRPPAPSPGAPHVTISPRSLRAVDT